MKANVNLNEIQIDTTLYLTKNWISPNVFIKKGTNTFLSFWASRLRISERDFIDKLTNDSDFSDWFSLTIKE